MYKKLLIALSFAFVIGVPFVGASEAQAAPPPPHHRMGPPPPRHHVDPPAPPAEITLERLRRGERPVPPPPRPHHHR